MMFYYKFFKNTNKLMDNDGIVINEFIDKYCIDNWFVG